MRTNLILISRRLLLAVGGLCFALATPRAGVAAPETPQSGWEKLSFQAAQKGDYSRALDYLRRLELKRPDDPALRVKKVYLLSALGRKLYAGKKYASAQEAMLEVLDLQPDHPGALKTLGYVAYYSQNLDEARDYWQKALKINPGDLQLSSQLQKLKRELKVEDKLDSSYLPNFDIRFHSDRDDYNISDIQSYLLDAYREVGYDFNFYPERSIVVILYTQEEFEHLRNTPQWVGGIYDGKIRLPVREGRLRAHDFKKILWHEYTHALIHDLAGNYCPVWLHEGLAQYQEAKVEMVNLASLYRARREGTLIPLTGLDQAFGYRNNPATVNLAYAEAYSFTEYLIGRYGFWKVNLILESLKKGGDWKTVLENEFFTSIADLEEEWHQNLEAGLEG